MALHADVRVPDDDVSASGASIGRFPGRVSRQLRCQDVLDGHLLGGRVSDAQIPRYLLAPARNAQAPPLVRRSGDRALGAADRPRSRTGSRRFAVSPLKAGFPRSHIRRPITPPESSQRTVGPRGRGCGFPGGLFSTSRSPAKRRLQQGALISVHVGANRGDRPRLRPPSHASGRIFAWAAGGTARGRTL